MTALLFLMENCNISQKMAGGKSTIAGQHSSTYELMKLVNLDEDIDWVKNLEKECLFLWLLQLCQKLKQKLKQNKSWNTLSVTWHHIAVFPHWKISHDVNSKMAMLQHTL